MAYLGTYEEFIVFIGFIIAVNFEGFFRGGMLLTQSGDVKEFIKKIRENMILFLVIYIFINSLMLIWSLIRFPILWSIIFFGLISIVGTCFFYPPITRKESYRDILEDLKKNTKGLLK